MSWISREAWELGKRGSVGVGQEGERWSWAGRRAWELGKEGSVGVEQEGERGVQGCNSVWKERCVLVMGGWCCLWR